MSKIEIYRTVKHIKREREIERKTQRERVRQRYVEGHRQSGREIEGE